MKAKTKNNVLTIKSVTQFGEDIKTTLSVMRNSSGEDYILLQRRYLADNLNGRVVNVLGIRDGKFDCVEELCFYVSSFKEIIKWATDVSTF